MSKYVQLNELESIQAYPFIFMGMCPICDEEEEEEDEHDEGDWPIFNINFKRGCTEWERNIHKST